MDKKIARGRTSRNETSPKKRLARRTSEEFQQSFIERKRAQEATDSPNLEDSSVENPGESENTAETAERNDAGDDTSYEGAKKRYPRPEGDSNYRDRAP